jgi:NADH:ubiquinone oxidoreductase subunit 6 (subunit J)
LVEKIVSVALTLIRAGTRLYATVLVVALMVLFLPAGLIQRIGFTELREAHRAEFGLAVIACGSLLLVHLVVVIAHFATAPLRRRRSSTKHLVHNDGRSPDVPAGTVD